MLHRTRLLRRPLAALSLAALVAASTPALAGTFMPDCYKPAVGSSAVMKFEPRNGPYRIAVANGHTGIPWRMQMIQSVKAWASRPENARDIAELKIVSTGPDVAAQIAAIDNFIQAGFDAVAFIAVNPKAFDAVIKRARKAGTVLVSFDNPVDSPDVLRITPDWIEFEGAIKTQAVIDQMPVKKGVVLEVRGIAGNSTDRDRHLGFRQVIEKYPDIKVVEVVGNWDTGTVQKVVSDALAVHGHFDAVVCQHGCRGVTNALAAAGHPKIPVGGDAENGFVRALAENGIPGISVSTSPGQGPVAVRAAIALLKGESLPGLVNLPTPNVRTADMKPGVNYFPNMPDTYETVSGYAVCGKDMVFAPEELIRQTPDNN
ncbi:substrate-binding domain-containing protein [Starkeya sp. ORNL1]|uniref:sugar ABC transporter substrate-binding protein n=1 Tax=Starkeya sp. ORNL1 TaxID=2709380 RepID=UPI0014645A25|nr:sugar ABC transporter substrate-binding protein [Starkeya sp. ORNL1]QJP14219.1 substrate-binding domain-containing protein [Starkeya sp. ORNL1]